MISATKWVPRGFAAQFPEKFHLDDDEVERISAMAKLQLDDAKEDLEDAEESSKTISELKGDEAVDDDLKEYDLEHYDDEEDEGVEDGSRKPSSGNGLNMFGNIKSLAYYENPTEDPYVTLPDEQEVDEEREELQILSSDLLLLAARTEDDVSQLVVYVYEDQDEENLYVHHDLMLPSFPLCIEWLDVRVGKGATRPDEQGNFAAVGTFEPDIEIFNLDVVDSVYPDAILGPSAADSVSGKKKKNKKKKINENYHVDAVLSLASNWNHRNLLSSASADKTIKLWDLNKLGSAARSFSNLHTDKVCSLNWHPTESTVLLSGAYDRTVVAADMRAPESDARRWGVDTDVEMVRWDPHSPSHFYVSTESGMVHYIDARHVPTKLTSTRPIWKLQAHDSGVSALDINPVVPGYFATGSSDKTVKLWNVRQNNSENNNTSKPSGPSMIASRDLNVGKVFSVNFVPESNSRAGFELAAAGSAGIVQIWDTLTNRGVRSAISDRLGPVKLSGRKPSEDTVEKIVGAASDQEESEVEELQEDEE